MPRFAALAVVLSVASSAHAQDLDTQCRTTAAPDIGLLRDCVLEAGITGRERADVVARFVATFAPADVPRELLALAIARQPVVRNAIRRQLVRLHVLSPAAAARIPTRAEAYAKMRVLLAPLRLSPAMLCCPEDLRILDERPRGTLHVGSDAMYCADGAYLESRFEIDDGGWRLVRAAAADTGPP